MVLPTPVRGPRGQAHSQELERWSLGVGGGGWHSMWTVFVLRDENV